MESWQKVCPLKISNLINTNTYINFSSSRGGPILNGNNGGLMVRPNHNVHVSINRRIEMPPAFHFPEDQIPPSDLVGLNNHDSPDNAQAVSGAYRLVEFFNFGPGHGLRTHND